MGFYNNKKNRFLTLLLLCTGFVVFIAIYLMVYSHRVDMNREYSNIYTSTIIKAKIKNKKNYRGAIYFVLSNGEKYKVGNSRNYNYENAYINTFLCEEDSILKDKNNDTLFVYRDSKEFIFILDRAINKY